MIEDTDGEDQLLIKSKNPNWETIVKNFKIDPTLKWEKAEVTLINQNNINFRTIKGTRGTFRKR